MTELGSFGKLHNKCADEERKKGDLEVNFIPAPSERIHECRCRFRGRSGMCGV